MKTEDTRPVRERLESEIGTVLASDLQAHMARGVVVVVDGALSLLDVAVAVAEDDVAKVQTWIDAAQMKNPSAEQIESWRDTPERPFRSVIVRPYVLIQEISQ